MELLLCQVVFIAFQQTVTGNGYFVFEYAGNANSSPLRNNYYTIGQYSNKLIVEKKQI